MRYVRAAREREIEAREREGEIDIKTRIEKEIQKAQQVSDT